MAVEGCSRSNSCSRMLLANLAERHGEAPRRVPAEGGQRCEGAGCRVCSWRESPWSAAPGKVLGVHNSKRTSSEEFELCAWCCAAVES